MQHSIEELSISFAYGPTPRAAVRLVRRCRALKSLRLVVVSLLSKQWLSAFAIMRSLRSLTLLHCESEERDGWAGVLALLPELRDLRVTLEPPEYRYAVLPFAAGALAGKLPSSLQQICIIVYEAKVAGHDLEAERLESLLAATAASSPHITLEAEEEPENLDHHERVAWWAWLDSVDAVAARHPQGLVMLRT